MSAVIFIAIGFGVWMLVVSLVLSLVRVAGRTETYSESPSARLTSPRLPAAVLATGGPRDDPTLGRMLRVLASEDPSAGRHAAAVARNAFNLAQHAGLPERDQEIAHTAGLLHDIGKETSLSAIPVAERALRRGDHRKIRRHPVDGARLVGAVPGLERVADAVLSHHERLDGNGYPYGLRGKAIPPAARVVAVAEVYDVLTAPDSYKQPLTSEQALDELRGAAGTQLDADLVEIFAATVANEADEGASGDADLETELRRRHLAGELLDARPPLH